MKKGTFIILLLWKLFASCNPSVETNENYEYVKLNEFKFSPAQINKGTKIEILSYSGGKDKEDGKIYYKQFIGIDKSNGDTVRILSLALRQQYDYDKALRIGIFETDMPMRDQIIPGDNEFIIFNKNQAGIEKVDVKAAFGILTFEE